MSRICYLVVSSMEKDPKTLRGSIEQYLDRKGYAAFFLYEYPEPVLERYREGFLICSISDNKTYDNCEMLLLPENCMFNGRRNVESYYYRMQILSGIISQIINMGYKAELFIGLSGDSYEDYEEVSISIKEFPKAAESLLNNEWDKEVHFLFNEDWLGMEM